MKTGLNLGCGTRIFKSNDEIAWVNLDIVDGPGVDVVWDWRDLGTSFSFVRSDFNAMAGANRDFDIIIAHQTFEHQGCGEQPIRQCYEILKPGGSLIVSVPNLRNLARMWLNDELSTQIYVTNLYGPYDGTEGSRHRWGFDPDSLYGALSASAPWTSVLPFDWRPIPGADIARDDRWILCMEAVK